MMRVALDVSPLARRGVAAGLALALLGLCRPVPAEAFGQAAVPAEGTGTLEFNRHIRPILSEKCFFCHGPDKGNLKAGLRLDVEAIAEADHDGVRAIVPGDPAASELVARIHATDPDDLMPPADSERSLSDVEKELLTRWIREGAAYEKPWALMPPVRREPPAVQRGDWVRNPLDRFVLARLERAGLSPSAEADKITLCRRVYFDLLGLPPTPQEVDAFVYDNRPDAFEQLVDRLLASPHYGERMAVKWLDFVRYADTNGYHSDEFREMWAYRDYVIDAFNNDMPFDQFTIEQLAGDLLPDATRAQRVASGYNRLNQITAEGGAQPKEYEAIYAADRVRTAGSVWLGLTMNCTQCHDHKYDPLTMKDFYSFAAFFADVEEQSVYGGGGPWQPVMPLPSPEQEEQLAALDARQAELQQVINTQTPELDAAQLAWEQRLRAEQEDPTRGWAPVSPSSISSANGTTFEILADHSVLTTGPQPDREIYTITLPVTTPEVTGFLLDVLMDPSLVPQGLSRGNGNFVLTGVEAAVGDRVVPIAQATADYAQDTFPVADTLDDKPETGWAVSGHLLQNTEHQAVFELDRPLAGGPDVQLTIRLKFESAFPNHTIGRFRISLSGQGTPVLRGANVLPDPLLAVLLKPLAERNADETALLSAHFRSIAPELRVPRGKLRRIERDRDALMKVIPTTMITRALAEPRTVRILARGNWMDETGEIVTPNVPAALPPLPPHEGRATRLDLAHWLVAPENPLTARVFVNRLWAMFFGVGLSKVLDDFGNQGEPPSHPDLLDWLAVEFRESGWDVKHMIRLIVTSAAYRQSSVATPASRDQDPYNRMLAHQGSFRLPAEFVRDNALAISGLLSQKEGGRSVFPYQPDGYWDNCNTFRGPLIYTTDTGDDAYRRGLYTIWKRSFLHPSLLAFDAPTREECTAERTRSNTPLQALVLLNDPTYVEAARVFAERIFREGGTQVSDRLNWAFRQALSRDVTRQEFTLLAALLGKHYREYQEDLPAAQALLAVGQHPVAADIDPAELAAWTSVARAILNLHETITRS